MFQRVHEQTIQPWVDIPDGTSCVSSDWILDSLEKGKILGYDEYIIEEVDGEEEKDDNVSEDANIEEKEKEDNMDENKEIRRGWRWIQKR